MPLWTLQELEQLGTIVPSDADPELTGLCIDSRQMRQGELFIALSGDPGPRFHGGSDHPRDGHDFVPGAIAAGAGAILVSQSLKGIAVPCIQVENTLDSLWQLAALARSRIAGQVVAITGSAGKTTAKSWLAACLEDLCQVHSSVGSLNNHWGVPLSLGRMARQTDVGVIEIGTNHPGEIAPLSELAAPNVAVLLNVLPAHIGNFPSLQALTQEKLAIAAGLNSGGQFVLPFSLASGAATEVTFGFEADADVHGDYEITEHGWQVQANVLGESVTFVLREGGEHRVLTSLAVLATIKSLGYSVQDAASRLINQSSPQGRGNTLTANGVIIIDDSYNANPVSMIYALRGLASRSGRRIALLGEILELGDDAEHYHQEVAGYFSEIDDVITVGEGFQHHAGGRHFDSVETFPLSDWVSELQQGDVVLVKGSNKVFWQHDFVQQIVAKLEAHSSSA